MELVNGVLKTNLADHIISHFQKKIIKNITSCNKCYQNWYLSSIFFR